MGVDKEGDEDGNDGERERKDEKKKDVIGLDMLRRLWTVLMQVIDNGTDTKNAKRGTSHRFGQCCWARAKASAKNSCRAM